MKYIHQYRSSVGSFSEHRLILFTEGPAESNPASSEKSSDSIDKSASPETKPTDDPKAGAELRVKTAAESLQELYDSELSARLFAESSRAKINEIKRVIENSEPVNQAVANNSLTRPEPERPTAATKEVARNSTPPSKAEPPKTAPATTETLKYHVPPDTIDKYEAIINSDIQKRATSTTAMNPGTEKSREATVAPPPPQVDIPMSEDNSAPSPRVTNAELEPATRKAEVPRETASVEKTETTSTAPEAGEGKEEAKTHGERLENKMQEMLEELKDTKEVIKAFVALIKLLGAVGEYLKRAFDGSLSQRPEAPKDTQVASTDKKSESATRRDMVKELQKDAKGKEDTSKLPERMAKTQDGKKQEITRNDAEIKEYDKNIDTIKDENKELIDGKSRVEQQISDLKGDSNNESHISRLSLELQRLTDKIDANQRAIEKLAKQRDDLKARNEQLGKETKVLEDMRKDLDEALKKIRSILDEATSSMQGNLPSTLTETPFVEPDTDGSTAHIAVHDAILNKVKELIAQNVFPGTRIIVHSMAYRIRRFIIT